MKYITKSVVAFTLSALIFSTVSVAGNISIGHNIYEHELGGVCGMNGIKFTDIHTPSEWQSIYKDGKLEEKIRELCPKLEIYNEKWSDHLFSFLYEYGKGSGVQPTCK